MNVVKMAFEIHFVPNAVFPEMALPDFPPFFFLQGNRAGGCLRQMAAEMAFYQAPTCGEITVALRQSPNAVHMFRQYGPGNNCKGIFLSDFTHALAK